MTITTDLTDIAARAEALATRLRAHVAGAEPLTVDDENLLAIEAVELITGALLSLAGSAARIADALAPRVDGVEAG